jgi:hypothetical protein
MKYIFFLLGIFLIFTAGCTQPTSPTIQPSPTPVPLLPGQEAIQDVSLENSINLRGQWRYAQVEAFQGEMTTPEFDDSQWTEIEAPTTWDHQGMGDQVGKGIVVVYRRQIDIPAEWRGQTTGIHAWFNPFASQVFVNGERLEPERKPFAGYADISGLLSYGEENTIAVVVQHDGLLYFAESGPVRIGLLESRPVTQVVHEEILVETPDGQAEATIIRPTEKTSLPGFVLVATGGHGLAEKVTWYDLADDLARVGYVSMAVALPQQKVDGILAAVQSFREHPAVKPDQIVLFGVDRASEAVVQAGVQDANIKGIILLSPPQVIRDIAKLTDDPILLMASQGDRNGLILEQIREMGNQVENAEVVSLPGDGHGTFIITNTWNALRQSLLDWHTLNFAEK